MTKHIQLDTRIHEPAMDADEIDLLVFGLERSRATFAWKVGGLDTAALNRPHPPSTMTLAGLIKHLAWVEDWRTSHDLTGEPIGAPWAGVEGVDDWTFRSAADHTAEELYAMWHEAVERNRAALAERLAHGGADQASKAVWRGQSPNLRRVLVDMHDEYARHVGHADLMREAIDGLVGEDPPQP
jgi:hypothetical protein